MNASGQVIIVLDAYEVMYCPKVYKRKKKLIYGLQSSKNRYLNNLHKFY